jgi:uncharacterized protein
MVHGYAKHYGLEAPPDEIEAQALEWATTRGSRSGRTAWQFTQDLAGRLGRPLVAADDAAPASTRSITTAKTP